MRQYRNALRPVDIDFMGFCIIAIAKLGLRHHQRKDGIQSSACTNRDFNHAPRERDALVISRRTRHFTGRRVPGGIVTWCIDSPAALLTERQ